MTLQRYQCVFKFRDHGEVHYMEEHGVGEWCLHKDASHAISELADALRELLDFSDPPHSKHCDRGVDARIRAAELLERMGE